MRSKHLSFGNNLHHTSSVNKEINRNFQELGLSNPTALTNLIKNIKIQYKSMMRTIKDKFEISGK